VATTPSLSSKTLTGAMWLVLWRMVTRVLGLASTLVLARILVPADFGLLAMASTFAAAIDSLSQLGLQDALVRRIADDRALFDTAFTLQAGRALLTSSIIVVSAPVASWWFNEPRLVPMLLVLAAGAIIAGLENVGIIEFRREMRFDMQFKLLSIPRLLQVATTIPLAIAMQSYWALMIGIIVAKLARTIMTYIVHPYRPALRIAGWRELAGFSFWTWTTCVAAVVWDRCDPFVVGPVVGTARLGVYLLAFEVAILPVSELIAPATDALFAGFASAQKQGGAIQQAARVALMLLMGIVPLIVTISCASGYVVAALLGPKWAEAQPLIAILAWQCVFSPFSNVCSVALVAHGRVRLNFIGNVIASAVKLAALLVVVSLTSRLTVIAAVTAACVAAESAIFLLLLTRVGDLRLRRVAAGVCRIALATGVTLIAVQQSGFAWQRIDMPVLPALVGGGLIGCAVAGIYAAALCGIWFMSGRPDGPELDMMKIVAERLTIFVGRKLRPGSAL
jgi:lipopolysaccharide exporter